jgi:hypothetical protein
MEPPGKESGHSQEIEKREDGVGRFRLDAASAKSRA